MKKLLILTSSLLLAAGCAQHRESMGGSTVSYNENTGYTGPTDAGVPTSKGAGAAALTGTQSDTYSTYSTVPAGGSEVYGTTPATAPGTVGGGPDAGEATTKGAGARALSGNSAYPDTTSAVGAATTEGSSTVSGTTTGNLSHQDSMFVREAAQSGLAEVEMGRLAQQNGQNQSLKDFGERIVADHSKANDELMQLAQQKGITAPTTMSAHQQHMISKLSSLSGAEFDRMYKQDAVSGHEKAVKLFRDQAENGQDPDLKAFAQKTLPTLEDHLRTARQLSSSSSGETSSTSSTGGSFSQ